MARGLTQRQLAERAGIADKYLSRLEVGAAGPSLHVASKLAAAVGVGLDGLLLLSVEPNPAEVATVCRLLRDAPPADRARALRVVEALLRK